jgi:hypothetical protein
MNSTASSMTGRHLVFTGNDLTGQAMIANPSSISYRPLSGVGTRLGLSGKTHLQYSQ